MEAGTDNMVEGILSWSNPDEIPATGTTQAGWIFKPTDSRHYVELTGTAAITVAKATPIVVKVPTVAEREYNPDAALTDSDMTGGSVTGADGNSLAGTWSFTGTNIVPTVNNTGYQAVFTPNDTNNYNTVTRTITVKVTKATPVIAEKPTAGALTYGQKLSDSTLTGGKAAYQTADGAEITGTFAWKNDTTKPAVGDSQKTEYDVTFTPSDKDNYNAVDTKLTLSITKAAAPTMQPIELTVINGLAKTYLVNLPALPTLGDNCKYGSIKYEACNFNLIGEGGYANSTAMITSNDEFQLTVPAVESQTEGSVGTVGVKITTDNYQDMLLTVEVIAKNKIVPVPDGEITATPITFGQILRVSNITGTMKGDGKPVEGTFEWTNPSTTPDKAGDYQAEWTFTPDSEEYATVTGKTTVKVAPKSIKGAKVTLEADSFVYDGSEKTPVVKSVVLDNVTLTSLTDYGYIVVKKSNVGIYNFTITGEGNYTGEVEATWQITAKEVTPTIEVASCSYTGDALKPNVTVKDDLGNTIDPEEYEIFFSNNTNAGTGRVTIKDVAGGNYVIEEKTQDFTITKAAAPTNIPSGTLNIINGTYQTYTYDFAQLLPELSKGKYGTVSYGNRAAISVVPQSGYYYDDLLVEFNNGVLTLAQFYAKDGTMTGQIGTAKVTVTTTNYENFQLTLVLNAVDQIKPVPDDTSTITASEITYGDTLSKSEISGKMQDPNTGDAVKGTFAWTNKDFKPDASDRYEAEWTFTPDAPEYATVTGTVTIKVNKATPTFNAPTARDNLTYTGQEQALITAGSVKDYGPTMQYSLKEDGTYSQDIPTGTDAGTYTVYYKVVGDKNHNYTAPASVEVRIGKKPLTITGVTAASKHYDGTKNADITRVTFDNVTLKRDTDYTVTASFDDASVGSGKNVTATVALTEQAAKNYALEQSSFTATGSGSITAKEVKVTITPNGGTYGSVTAATATLSGVVEGETVPVTLTYTGNGYNSTTVPVNAGSYTVTASIADSNYVLTGKTTANFVIEPKSIKDAKVVLGNGLAANGAEQTQTVAKVLLVNKELPADSYTVSGNTATAHGIYTLTVTGKGNYKDFVKWTYVIAPSKAEDAPGEDITIGSGKVKVDVQSEGTVPPATLLTDKAELLAMLVNNGDITADELVQIANGASVDIVLTVKEANVSDEVKTAMAQAAKGYTIGQYLDISLFKYMTVNGSQQAGVPLHTTKDALTISVVVPDALINTNSAVNRTYCIVRRHDGAITVLDAAFDAAGKTLTFKTDRFSIYAIAYKDTAVPSSGSNPGSNNSSNDSETKKNEVAAPTPAPTPASTSKPSTITAMPQTGDTSNPTLYVVLLVASLLGLAVVFVCKKRNDK